MVKMTREGVERVGVGSVGQVRDKETLAEEQAHFISS